MPILRLMRWRSSQLTAGLSTAARKRARTPQPMIVRTCHSRKRAPNTTAVARRATTTMRTTCEGAMRTHTTPSLSSAGAARVAGSVCEGSVSTGSSEGRLFSLIVALDLLYVLAPKVRHCLLSMTAGCRFGFSGRSAAPNRPLSSHSESVVDECDPNCQRQYTYELRVREQASAW